MKAEPSAGRTAPRAATATFLGVEAARGAAVVAAEVSNAAC